MKNSLTNFKIKKLKVVFEDSDYEYEIPIEKLAKFSRNESIKDVIQAALQAVRRI